MERLFDAKGLCADDFDDNALARGLDKIAEYGTSKLFSELAFELLNREGLLISIQRDEDKLHPQYNACGRFILGTNDTALSPEDMQTQYKEQDSVERGFRFLKDGEYRLNHIFLKKNSRIEALMTVLTLALPIYSVSQKHIRELLVKTDPFYPNQIRKPIQNPTLRWILRRISYDRICFLEQDGKVNDTCNVSEASMTLFKLMGKEVLAQYALD